MNERIKELAKQAGYFLYDLTETHERKTVETDSKDEWITLERFAELIVEDIGEMLRGLLVEESFDKDIGSYEYWNKALGHLALEIEQRYGENT
jgi:hypothetical protein